VTPGVVVVFANRSQRLIRPPEFPSGYTIHPATFQHAVLRL